MNTSDKQIADILAKYGEPLAGNVWCVQGTAVIYHKTLERIAAQAHIQFGDPHVIRAERDECVLWVEGWIDHDGGATGPVSKRLEWSFGEACINQNYRVSGKQAAYPYAMAEKRAKDRVILKLINLSGLLYSEEEADEFKDARPTSMPSSEPSEAEMAAVEASKKRGTVAEELKQGITKCRTHQEVAAFMGSEDTQAALASMYEGPRDEVRAFAVTRMKELGWTPKPRAA